MSDEEMRLAVGSIYEPNCQMIAILSIIDMNEL